MFSAMFIEGGVNVGWTFYIPLSIINSSSIDLLFSSPHIAGLSSLLGSINFIVTILKASSFTILQSILSYILIILIGFRYTAPSTPITSLLGAAIGVGIIYAASTLGISRNPSIINLSIRWPFIALSLCEASGFIGTVYPPLISYALYYNIIKIKSFIK